MKRIKKTPFLQTLLFSVFPTLSLLAHNAREIPLLSGLRALALSAVGVTLIYLLLWRLIYDKNKAALITTLGSAIFFLYGHLYSIFGNIAVLSTTLGRHRFLAPISLIIFITGASFILQRKKINTETILSMNLIGVLLVFIPIFQISQIQINQFLLQREKEKEQAETVRLNPTNLPDIYYIILDGYPREDILQQTFGLDNSQFITWLEAKGFYVAECSQSNYSHTAPSMAATFNLTYLGNEEYPNSITKSEDELY
jgi:hypothetical protein